MSIERRLTTRLIEYWVKLKGDNELPLDKNISDEEFKDCWESCFELQLIDICTGNEYNYSFLGSEIIKAYGCDLSKDEDNLIISTVASKLDAQYQGVLSGRMPMETEGEFTNANGKKVAFRQCLLPFSSDGMNATTIFGGMRYKIFDE